MSPLLMPEFFSRSPASQKRGYSARPFWACLLAFFLLAILSWVSGRLAEPTERVSVHHVAQLRMRDNALEVR